MATAVGLRSGQQRNWTGSLSDLDSCGQLFQDYLDGRSQCQGSEFLSWKSAPSELAHTDLLARSDPHGTHSLVMPNSLDPKSENVDPSALSVSEYLRWDNFLDCLQKSFHQGQSVVTAEQLRQFPLTLFSSVLDKARNHKNKTNPSETGLANASSESKLTVSISDTNFEQCCPLDPRGVSILIRQRRRHCNSESDLTWSLPENQPNLWQEVKSEFVSSTDETDTLNAPLNVRYDACENLTDTVLYETPGPVGFELVPNKNEPQTCVGLTIELNDTDTSTSTNELSALVTTSTPSKTSQPDALTGITHPLDSCPIDITIAPPDEEIPDSSSPAVVDTDNLDVSSSEASGTINRTDSCLTVTSVLTSSSSVAKLPKSVSFADECGQSLTEVFVIDSNEQIRAYDYDDPFDGPMWPCFRKPKLLKSGFSSRFARSRLKHQTASYTDDYSPSRRPTSVPTSLNTCTDNRNAANRSIWLLGFSQPAAQYYEFRQRVENGAVCLENITLTQPDETFTNQLPHLSGTIKVKNVSFEKQVWLRITTDNWHSYTDHMALYNPQLSGGLLHSAARFDTFAFQVNVSPQLETGRPSDRIEFAIRYLAGPDGSKGQFWDNNNGRNYVIERRTVHPYWPNQLSPTNDDPTKPATAHPINTMDDKYRFDSISEVDHNTAHCCYRPYTPDYRPNFDGITQFTNYRAWDHFSGETTYY